MTTRTVRNVYSAARDDIADLVTRRPLPSPSLAQLDPFLFLNHHGPQVYPPINNGLPFGPHPHRGFETVTFILDGELAHYDSDDHASVIKAGGVQWMTAGRGLVHAEVSPEQFMQEGGPLEILQLWVNLPARLKMTAPAYVGIQREQIPRIAADQNRVHLDLISGEFEGHKGPISSLTGVFMSTVGFAPGGRLHLPAPRGRTVFLYIIRGEIDVAGRAVNAFNLIELNNDGDEVDICSSSKSLIVFGHADPIGEPVVAHGPFVMNTREEILKAIEDYNAGKFGGLTNQ